MRRKVGKYSVGFHLQAFNGGYVPYIYARDENGKVVLNGAQMDLSIFSKDPNLPKELQKQYADAQTIFSDVDVIPKLSAINEHFIDLMLNKK